MIEMGKIDLHSKLTLFDVTNLAVGSIIGADIWFRLQVPTNLE